jgi:hypothetical protein
MPQTDTFSDVTLEHRLSVLVLEFNTAAGKQWALDRLYAEGWMWIGVNRLAIEPRFGPDVLTAMLADGLTVET